MERDFEFGGRKFKLSKLDPFKQLRVVKRITPILSDLAQLFPSGLKTASSLSEKDQMETVTAAVSGLSKLTDDDLETVMHLLLEAVEIQQTTGNWARVSNGTMVMIQDLELPMLLNIAGRAFMYNLTRFFTALPQ